MYKHNKAWRFRHPDRRKKDKYNYYRKTQNAINGGDAWTMDDIKKVLDHEITDSELSKELGRSVGAIQKIRWKYKNNIGKNIC